MKRRYADARDNKDILVSKFNNIYVNDEYIQGNVSTLQIIKTKKRWIVDDEKRCIMDDGYIWLEIYPQGENYCITALCDQNKNIKEWYIDIAKYTGVEDGVPFEDDLYIDVVIVPDGRVHILDEDELQEAYHNGVITKEDWNLAYATRNIVLDKFVNNIEELTKMTSKYLYK